MTTTKELDAESGFVSGATEASVVASYAQQAAEPKQLDAGVIYALAGAAGDVEIHDTDDYAETPRRAKAARSVTDAASFVAYVNRHKIRGTEVYAHTSGSSVIAIIDSHEGSDLGAGWQGHRLTLVLEKTKAWEAWMKRDLGQGGAWFDQQEFAEFIEDRALDVIDPDHARLIEIATTFEAKSKADFGSAVRLDSGAVQFAYTETTAAKAGQKGTLEIPNRIQLALRPYIGGPIYSLWAQFRYRIGAGGLRLGYAIERPENILDAAFADIVTEIREGRTDRIGDAAPVVVHEGIGDVPIFYGRP